MSNTTQPTADTRPELAPPIDATDAAIREHTDIPSYLPDIYMAVEGGITTYVGVLPDRNPTSCYVLDWDDVRDSLDAARDAYEQVTGEALPEAEEDDEDDGPLSETLDTLVDAIRARVDRLMEVYRCVY